ncbi:MAG: UvrD-helicase domain-containing protein [Bacteroidota bacterium]
MKNITFINAGAGSGKTYSLTDELYRNIHNDICRGDQVLLTTFTKRAAEEIRQRAHAKLLEEGKTEDAIALQNAYIGTVHSVGYRLINKFCYLIGLSPNIKELAKEDTDFYFSQAVSKIPSDEELDKLAVLSELFQFQKITDDNRSEFDPWKWKGHVQTIINEARRNNIEDLTETGLSFVKSIEFIQSVFGVGSTQSLDFEKIKTDITAVFLVVENLPEKNNGIRKKKAIEIKASLNSKNISYSTLLDIYSVAGDLINKIDTANVPAANLLTALDSFYRSRTFRDNMAEYTGLIFKIAGKCIAAFTAYKREHGLVDYTDMETRFLELLNIPEVQAELNHGIKLVMVDEFQDSNPIQLSIFMKLAGIIDQSIWVGDPKQAIYGFNGSDPILVSELLKVFYQQNDQNLKLQLLKNSWRSRGDLVNMTNKIYEVCLEDQSSPVLIHKNDILGDGKSIQQWIDDKFGTRDQITLGARDTIGLIPVRRDKDQGFSAADNQLALKHWHFTNGYKGSGNTEQFNYYLARRIKELVAEKLPVYDKTIRQIRPMVPSDIAVLCRQNKEVKAIATELMQHDLEVAASVDGLSVTAEYRLLINILNYIADRSNSLAVTEIVLLINKDHAFTAESLIEKRLDYMSDAPVRNDEDDGEYHDYVSKWGKDDAFIQKMELFVKNSGHLSVPELIEKAVAELELTRHIAAWGNAEQRKANIQQMILYAHNYDDYCVKLNLASSLIGFVQWLKQDKEKNYQAASGNLNAVNVLTYHKAKGLEWPFVILTSLGHDHDSKSLQKDFFKTSVKMSATLDIEHPLSNRYIHFSFWPFGGKGNIMGFEDEIKNSAAFKEAETRKLQETKRLLYVGMTRARDYLTTTSFLKKEATWLNLVNSHDGNWSLEDMTNANVASATIDLFDRGIDVHYQVNSDERAEFSRDYEVAAYKPARYFEKDGAKPRHDPKYVQPSKLKGNNDVTVTLFHDFVDRIHTGNIKNETVMGNCLHDILYLLPDAPDESRIDSIIARHNLSGQIDKTDVTKAVEHLKNFIHALAPVKIHRELPMKMDSGGRIYIGSADLVLEFDDQLFLTDYKSYPGSVTEVTNPHSDHFAGIYSGQMNAYSEILESALGKKVTKKLIYYAVLGKIVEIV